MAEIKSIFEIYRDAVNDGRIDIKTYIEQDLGVELKKKGTEWETLCPFHSEKTPSFTIVPKKKFYHCFGCGSNGDLIKYVEDRNSLSNVDACKLILTHFNIPFDEYEELDDDQKKQLEAQRLEYEKQRDAEDAERRREKEEKKADVRKKMAPKAESFAEQFNTLEYSDGLQEILKKTIPNHSEMYFEWKGDYLGFDDYQDSLVILNRDVQKNETYNIIWRRKWIWDDVKKEFIRGSVREGKWIKHHTPTPHPFPWRHFDEHEDERILLLEGFKDSFNALTYNIRNLTLGGASDKWDPHLELFRGKDVYIMYDNDFTGYINALKNYQLLKPIAKNIYIVLMYQLVPGAPKGYDFTDFSVEFDFKDPDEFYDLIRYSCFRITDDVLKQLLELYEDEIRIWYKETEDPLDTFYRKFKQDTSPRDWEFIASQILMETKPVRGEYTENDNFVNGTNERFKEIKKDPEKYKTFKTIVADALFESTKEEEQKKALEWIERFEDQVLLSQRVLNDYLKQHVIDMFEELLFCADRIGYPFGEYQRSLYVWNGFHYMQLDETSIIKWIQNTWMKKARVDKKKRLKATAVDIYENILNCATDLDLVKKKEDRRFITVTNGTLIIGSLGKWRFKTLHDKNNAATNMLLFAYDPAAQCPKWKKFLCEILPDEDERNALMEYIGYCLMPSHEFEKFLFLHGAPGAGKSVILSVIRKFFGRENISNLVVSQLQGHEMTALSNKLINIGSEVGKDGMDKNQAETLKLMADTESYIAVNPKNHAPYDLGPKDRPKMITAGNNVIQKADPAVFRRMLYLLIEKSVEEKKKVTKLGDRFNDEMSGILNMALAGLDRLIRNRRFSMSERMKETMNEYRDASDPILAFTRTHIHTDDTCMVPTQFIYDAYLEYCKVNGHHEPNNTTFVKRFKEALKTLQVDFEIKQRDIPGYDQNWKELLRNKSNPRHYAGIRIMPDVIQAINYEKTSIPIIFCNVTQNLGGLHKTQYPGTYEKANGDGN